MEKCVVVYIGDKGFVTQIGVSMYSLFENNKDLAICVYLLSDHMPKEELNKFEVLALKFSQEIHILDIPPLEKLAQNKLYSSKDEEWPTLVFTRMFLTKILPKNIKKVLCLDGDTVIMGSIKSLFDTDINNYAAAAVLDSSNHFKLLNGFSRNDHYFNAGVCLLNLEYWRSHDMLENIIHIITKQHGQFLDNEQAVFNIVLKDLILVLKPYYNLMKRFYDAADNYDEYLKFSGYKKTEIYTNEEFTFAKNNISIIHFAGNGNRPWFKNCNYPLAYVWRDFLQKTPWYDFALLDSTAEKNPSSFKMRCKKIILMIVCFFPFLRKLYIRIVHGFWQYDL